MPWPVGFEPVDFKEATDWFLKRVPMTREDVDRLDAVAKRRAFFVSQVAELDVVTQAWKAADKAIAKGQTLADFKAEIGPKLEAAWAGSVADPAARLETIFRTNVQHAYAAGRHEQMNHPAVLKRRPYREFSAVMDGRISTICKPLDGVVMPAEDEFWQGRVPPLHFNCRSTVIPLTEKQAQEKGVKAAPAGAPAPLEGFGKPPGEEWKPGLEKYPEPLRELAEKKLDLAPGSPAAPPAAPPAPATPPAQPPAAPPGGGNGGGKPPDDAPLETLARWRLGAAEDEGVEHDANYTRSAHLADGKEARRDLRRGRSAHVFNSDVDLSALERLVWLLGTDDGADDHEPFWRRFTYEFEGPVGVRVQGGKPDIPLRVVEIKAKKDNDAVWRYHVVPRARRKRRGSK